MIRQVVFPILLVIGALCLATFGTYCTTTDEQSPHTERVREQNTHFDIMQRNRRKNRG